MIRSTALAGIALGLAVAAYVSRVPPVNRPASTGRVVRLATVPIMQVVDGQIIFRGRWGSLPGHPPSGGYCVDW
jgi:hypothetical protein